MHSGINRITTWNGIGILQGVRHNAHMHKMILRAKSGRISGLPAQTIYNGVRKATDQEQFCIQDKKFRLI